MHTRLIILTNELFIFFTHGFCDSTWLYQCQTFNLYHALIKVKTFWVNVIILPSIFLLNKKTVRGHVFMFLCGFFNWQYVYNTKEPPYTIVGFKHVYKSSTRKKAFIPAQTLYLLQSYFYKCNHYHENIKRSVVLRPYLL